MEFDRIVSFVFSRVGLGASLHFDCVPLVPVRALRIWRDQRFLGDCVHFCFFGNADSADRQACAGVSRGKVRGHVVHSRVLHRGSVSALSLRTQISDSDFRGAYFFDACDNARFSRCFLRNTKNAPASFPRVSRA